jgi:putative transposase
LKTFLTCSEGLKIESPEFLKASLNAIRQASRQHSKKQKSSNNREQARLNLVRRHEDIANRRRDWFWKLAHKLTDRFDVLCFETLNLKGMQRLWGRKISDLALGEFLQILEWVVKKKAKQIVYIDPWYPSTKTCSGCAHVLESLDLSVRRWRCPSCGTENDRDENASVNIKMVGSSTIGVGDVRQVEPAISVVKPESHALYSVGVAQNIHKDVTESGGLWHAYKFLCFHL